MSVFSPRSLGVISTFLLVACAADQPVAPVLNADGTNPPSVEGGQASAATNTLQLVPSDTVLLPVNNSRGGGRLLSLRSTNPSVATVNTKREVIALKPGVADIIEKNAGVDRVTSVTVVEGPAVLEATPATVETRVGELKRAGATVRAKDGRLLSSQTVRYRVIDTTVASVSGAGDVYGRKPGTTVLWASHGEGFVEIPVNIAAAPGVDPTQPPPPPPSVITSFAIAPKNVSLSTGESQQFSATARAADGTTVSSAVSYVAAGGTITMSGLYTAGQVAGAYMVIATCACGKVDTAYASVAASSSPPPVVTLTSLTIAPKTALVMTTSDAQFSVASHWSNGDATDAPTVYSATGGTVTSTGAYTAPSTPGTYFVIVRHQGGTLADTATVTVEAPVPPAEGVLFSHGFDNGTLGGLYTWGTPRVVNDATATGGKSVQIDWVTHTNSDSDQGIGYPITGTAKKIHIRFRYKQDANASNAGIKKTVRFRGDNNKALGTFNIQWGSWLFNGDDYSMAPWNIMPIGRGTTDPIYVNNVPDTFRDRWRYIEVMLDYSTEGRVKSAMWVDGQQIINYDAALNWTLPANFSLRQVWLASVYNNPVPNQTDWFDSVVVSTSYIGTP